MDVSIVNNKYELALGNFVAFLKRCIVNRKSDALLDIKHGATWINSLSQYPLFNGVFDYESLKAVSPDLLLQAKQFFNGKPFTWWYFHEAPIAESTLKLFRDFGFHSAGKYKGIVMNINKARHPKILSDTISIEKVDSDESYALFLNIFFEVFQIPGALHGEFREMLNPFLKNMAHVNYLGFYKGKAAGTLTAFVENGILGIYNGATLPQARRHGLLTALMSNAIKDFQAKRCRSVVGQLMAKNMAEGAANSLGFRSLCEFTPYVYGFSPENLEP